MEPSRWLTNAVATVVMLGWVSSFGTGIFNGDWTALTITTPLMLALAGYAFGIKIIQRQRPNGGKK